MATYFYCTPPPSQMLSTAEGKEKNLDTQLTANMISFAAQNMFDTAILVSNDRDYVSALEPTKNIFGKK